MLHLFRAIFSVILLQVFGILAYLFGTWLIGEPVIPLNYLIVKISVNILTLLVLLLLIRKRIISVPSTEVKLPNDVSLYFALVLSGFFLYIWKFPLYHFNINLSEINPDLGLELSAKYYLLEGISKIILVPVLEEVFIKIFILNYLLNQGIRKWKAIILSSLLFAYLHFDFFYAENSVIPVISAFIFGIFSGIIFAESRKVKYTIIQHSAVNLLAYLTTVLFVSDFHLWLQREVFGGVYWTVVIIGMLCFVLSFKYVINIIHTKPKP